MKNLIFTLALVFALASLHSFAGSIFGSVKDENGNPVAGAEVKVYGKDIKTKTNEKGLFKIENELLVDGNRYSVRVEADGFDSGQTLSTEVFDDPEEMEALDVVMYKAEPVPETPPTAETNAPAMIEGIVQPQQPQIEDATNEVISVSEKVEEVKEEIKE